MSSFVDSAEFERLLEMIAADDRSLTDVDLEFKWIGDAGATRLAEALRGNTHVTVLNLRHNFIGDDGVRSLAEMLRTNSAITELNLVWNNIGDDGARTLAQALRSNSAITQLCLQYNNIGDEGGRAILELLQTKSSITLLELEGYSFGNDVDIGNDVDEDLATKIEGLVNINDNAPNPQEAHRLKIECRIGWMLDSEDGSEYEAAVYLALAELDSFPTAERRQGLFERLLGSTEIGADVAASVDVSRGRVLYWYAAECGAAPVVLMNLLRAHPSLCACRDVKHKLFPFMLLATMQEAGADGVLEALLENPSLVESGIRVQDVHRAG